ncbi:NIL domain-containing protein [Chryseobacterium sp. CT-SW4]|uniref:NIL domain-containing protein n=1 Tax=Chryseobacterium sp. SW-1 TaxID=3157343 RepID=UPI003B0124E9
MMITPNPNLQVLEKKLHLPKKELILEIELNGKMKFEHLMNAIYNQFGICHRVLSANVEYVEGRSFGSVQLYINVNSEDYQQLEFYLNKNKLLNTTVEYVCRKYL